MPYSGLSSEMRPSSQHFLLIFALLLCLQCVLGGGGECDDTTSGGGLTGAVDTPLESGVSGLWSISSP